MLVRATYWVAAAAVLACPAATQTRLTPDEALAALKAGNQRFAAGGSTTPPLGEGVRRTLASGQSPFAIVLTCADSRVAPEHVFNCGLGELFVVRVAGNVCDPESLASIEYAAEHLGAPLCVVMAHERCGAVAAAVNHADGSPALTKLLERMAPAVQAAHREGLAGELLLAKAETENAHLTIGECQRRSPALRELVRLRRLRFVAAHYQLDTGEVQWLPERPVESATHAPVGHASRIAGMPPHVALTMLQAGHRRFLAGSGATADLSSARRESLAAAQRPLAVVLTCADSRVPPEHLFDVGLGEVFVVRVAGNVVSDEALASIEYAVEHLGAGLIMVMGHQSCGAVRAAAETAGTSAHASASMLALLARLEPAVEAAKHEGQAGSAMVERAVELNALRSCDELRRRSLVLHELESAGKLGIVPVVYELGSGDLRWLRERATVEHATPMGHATHQPPTHGADHGHHAEQPTHGSDHAAHQPTTHGADHGHHAKQPTHGSDHATAPVDDHHQKSFDPHPGTGHEHAHPPADHAVAEPAKPSAVRAAIAGTAPPRTKPSAPPLWYTLAIALLAASTTVLAIALIQRRRAARVLAAD